ncbi:hypothetical protein C8Q76DRAFT_757313 [Earliella scabrosa]|nr:hypothetical protein C8Q76DRAFT_757313 [Earliella scabrosa]
MISSRAHCPALVHLQLLLFAVLEARPSTRTRTAMGVHCSSQTCARRPPATRPERPARYRRSRPSSRPPSP